MCHGRAGVLDGWDAAGGGYYFTADDNAKFSYPVAGSIGNSGRNAFRGPRYFNLDATLSKRFRIAEGMSATMRIEAYNLFNQASFGTPGTTLTSPASLTSAP